MKSLIYTAGICVCLLMSCTAPVDETTAESSDPVPVYDSPEVVLDRHLADFGGNDLEGIMADYADDAIIFTQDSTYVGKDAIRGLFTAIFPDFPANEMEFTMDKLEINGSVAFIVWHCTTPTLDVPFATDTFIIEDGKIQRQTFAAVINPKATN